MPKIPMGIGEHFEQLRDPIVRSPGTTETERYLARLADRSFLNLWSYPNPFRDQRISGGKEGKELCDLLVVCDPHIIIFSEKRITWPDNPTDLAWTRWYRRAVEAAAAQLRGAERWIRDYPGLIFLDRQCSQKLPLALPAEGVRRVHRVVVAQGSADASKAYFSGGTGSLVIKPSVKGLDHTNLKSPNYAPFHVGDVDPSSDFVHVFDEAALTFVLSELDTITDFTSYLDRRAAFLRSGLLREAAGEESLLSYYAVHGYEDGTHDFVPPKGKSWNISNPVTIDESNFVGLINDPRYLAKKHEDKVSYAWDKLIEAFTDHILGGTSIVLPGFQYSLTNSEIGLRHMALRSRLDRRGLSTALLDALRQGQRRQVFFRVVVYPEHRPSGTAFFFLTVKYLSWMDQKGGYEQYRLFRSGYAELYAKALLIRYRSLDRVVGIAMEPPGQGRGSSEDCVYGVQKDWSEDEVAEVQTACDKLGIMQSQRKRRFHLDEFPSITNAPPPPRPFSGLNRRERRAKAAAARKGNPSQSI